MTEHDYEKALKLLVAVEAELAQGNPDGAHCLIIEALSLFEGDTGQPDYDYSEVEENLEIDLDGGLSAINE
jgi:hypothetical protein